MKRMKWVALLLVVMFVLSVALSGCAPKTQSNVIKIGYIGPLTGDASTFGTSTLNATQLFFKQHNNQVAGYTVDLITQDDANNANQAVAAATKLITQDKVSLILGSVTSKCTIPISEICGQYKVPFITPTATNPKVTVENGVRKQYAFRVCFTDQFQGPPAAKFAIDTLKAKTAAIMYDQGNDYSSGLKGYFGDAFKQDGGTVVDTEAYTVNDTDFSAALTKIAGLNPDILYLPDYYNRVSLIGAQARKLGIKATFMGSDGWDSSQLDFKAMDGGYFTNHYSPDDPNRGPLVDKWVNDYKAAYGSVPDALATLGYEACEVAFQAITNAQSTDPTKIKDAIQSLKDFQVVTAKITFDQNGDVLKPLSIIQIKNGKENFVTAIQPT